MVLELLQSHGITPKKKAGTNGGEYASPCPACGGRDRFMCWPEQGEHGTWWCRGCDKGGDAIEFLRVFDGLSFAEACERLGVSREYQRKPLSVPKSKSGPDAWTPKEYAAPEGVRRDLWQPKAAELLGYAHKQLLDNPAEMARLAARGLPREAVERFRLGWLPGERNKKTGQIADCYYRARAAWGLPEVLNDKGEPKKLWIPRGLVIPVLGPAGEVLRLRIRRPDADRERFLPDRKFSVVQGSLMGPLLLLPEWTASEVAPARAAERYALVVQESELDGMACVFAAERAGLPVGSLAVGTNLGKPDSVAHAALSESVAILVALDFDPPDAKGKRPGAQGFGWWRGQYRQAERWPSAIGKDVGEGVSQGMDLAAWLRAGLPPVLCLSSAAKAATDAARPSQSGAALALDSSLPLAPAGGSEVDPGPATAPCPTESPKKSMPVGPSTAGLSVPGQGGKSQVNARQEHRPSRWAGRWADVPLEAVILPEPAPTVEHLRRYYAGKVFEDDLLIPCPKASNSWWWTYCKYCRKCAGHPLCLLDFVMSSRMLAPLEEASIRDAGEVRVSPESDRSPGRPDAVTSDQENSQPSCGAAEQRLEA